MRNSKVKKLRKQAKKLATEMGFQTLTEYMWVDPNQSDMGVFCSPKEGKESTLQIKPDTLRSVYKELKRLA